MSRAGKTSSDLLVLFERLNTAWGEEVRGLACGGRPADEHNGFIP